VPHNEQIGTPKRLYNSRMTSTIQSPNRLERAKADALLLVVAFIWGVAFVAQRVAALNMGVYAFNGLRFLLGALVLLPFSRLNRPGATRLSNRDRWGIALVGLLLLAGASFQQLGLHFTSASNAGFITGLYVVFIPLILAVGWRQRMRWAVWIAALSAALGLFLLSTGGQLRLAPGDALVLLSAAIWACHVIWIGRLVGRIGAMHIAIGQSLVCGGLSLALALLSGGAVFPQAAAAWWALAYTGVLSVGVGYTAQAMGQRLAPPADAAIILSFEAVFAALGGWLLLGERLSAVQLLGCGLMLAGMLLAQIRNQGVATP